MTHGNNRGRESSTGRQAFPAASAHISSSSPSSSSYALDLLVVDSVGPLCCN